MINNSWWHERTEREQYILGVGGVLVIVLLVYVLIWKPLTSHVASMREDIVENTSLLSWVDSAADRIEQFRKQGYVKKQPSTQAILVLVEQSLMQNKLSQFVSNTQQKNNQQIILTMKNAPFDKVMDWLEKLWKTDNVLVNTVAVTNTTTSGVVNLTVSLKK
jgi:general secretion pathway protein M